jgi:2'-5' RNA ligase
VELPQSLRPLLKNHIQHLRDRFAGVSASWSSVEKIHLTIKFFGDVEATRTAKLSTALQRAVEKTGPFEVDVSGCGTFPPIGAPKVLWIGITDLSGALSNLQHEIEAECAAEGFPKDNRLFHPHLTIARIRRRQGSRALAEAHKSSQFDRSVVPVSEIVLFRSELRSKGSNYLVISRHRLSA